MCFAKRFVAKFSGLFVCLLSCFDRVIFKGHLPFGGDDHLDSYVDHVLKMKRKDVLPWLQQHSQTLVDHAQQLAQQYGRPYEYRQGRFKKAFIHELIRRGSGAPASRSTTTASSHWTIRRGRSSWRIASRTCRGSSNSTSGRGASTRC